MKKKIILAFLTLFLIIGCSPQSRGTSLTSYDKVLSSISSSASSLIDQQCSSSSPFSLNNIALKQPLPYINGKIDFKKIVFGYNIIYGFSENYNNDFNFAIAYDIINYYGIYDFSEHVKQELEPFFNYTDWTITLPAAVVDNYILTKFDVNVDRSLITMYHCENQEYFINPFTGEYYYETEIVSYEQLLTGYYEVIVKTREDIMDKNQKQVEEYVQKFVIDCSNNDYKYISVNLISFGMVDAEA